MVGQELPLVRATEDRRSAVEETGVFEYVNVRCRSDGLEVVSFPDSIAVTLLCMRLGSRAVEQSRLIEQGVTGGLEWWRSVVR